MWPWMTNQCSVTHNLFLQYKSFYFHRSISKRSLLYSRLNLSIQCTCFYKVCLGFPSWIEIQLQLLYTPQEENVESAEYNTELLNIFSVIQFHFKSSNYIRLYHGKYFSFELGDMIFIGHLPSWHLQMWTVIWIGISIRNQGKILIHIALRINVLVVIKIFLCVP